MRLAYLPHIIAALAIAAASRAAEPTADVLVSVASYHWQRSGQDEINPGLGLSLGYRFPTVEPYVAGMAYRDSHGAAAQVAVAGLRYDLTTWAGLDLAAGYLHSSTYEGPGVIPGVYVGSGPVRACVSVLGTRAMGFTVRWSL